VGKKVVKQEELKKCSECEHMASNGWCNKYAAPIYMTHGELHPTTHCVRAQNIAKRERELGNA